MTSKSDMKFNAITAAESSHFPEDLPDRFMSFQFQEYNWDLVEDSKSNKVDVAAIERPLCTIGLPIPANLIDSTGISYSTKDVGYIGVDVMTGITHVKAETFDSLSKKSLQDAQSFVGSLTDTLDKSLAAAAFKTAGGALSVLGASMEMSTGKVVNPNSYESFNNVEIKTHNFSWDFIPLSQSESDALNYIIKTFKIYSLPAMDGKFLRYPALCTIKINPDPKYLYRFKPCFLTNVAINYAPYGPSFFKHNNAPVAVSLAVSFVETSIWTRDEMDDTSDISQPKQNGGTLTGWTKGQKIVTSTPSRQISSGSVGIGGLMGVASSLGFGQAASAAGAAAGVASSIGNMTGITGINLPTIPGLSISGITTGVSGAVNTVKGAVSGTATSIVSAIPFVKVGP